MNYLAHGLHLVDTPWMLAGAALPDWLRVVDKRARLHPHLLDAHTPSHLRDEQLRDGAHRHHVDDAQFHADERVDAVVAALAQKLRARVTDPRVRASTFAHVVVEMLLDAALMERDGTFCARYYEALHDVDAHVVADFARRVTQRPLEQLPTLIDRFRAARFLDEYATDRGLFGCVVGLCARAGLVPPPAALVDVIGHARPQVRALLGTLPMLHAPRM